MYYIQAQQCLGLKHSFNETLSATCSLLPREVWSPALVALAVQFTHFWSIFN